MKTAFLLFAVYFLGGDQPTTELSLMTTHADMESCQRQSGVFEGIAAKDPQTTYAGQPVMVQQFTCWEMRGSDTDAVMKRIQ